VHAKVQTIWVSLLVETPKKSYRFFSHDASSAFETFWFRGLAPNKQTYKVMFVGTLC
jgi:hypothetical protein